jgi:hypothetical protein
MKKREKDQPAENGKRTKANRRFEQPEDAISFYADMTQIIGTDQEVVMQLYESVPGTPSPDGHIKEVRTRLRVTATLSKPHATNLGKILLEKASSQAPPIQKALNKE